MIRPEMIRVLIEEMDRRYHATSPDLPGLYAAERDLDVLRGDVLAEICRILREQGHEVAIRELTEVDSGDYRIGIERLDVPEGGT